MRRPLLALAALALAVPALPALAVDDERHAPCANPDGLPVLTVGGEAASGTIATPSAVGNATESVLLLVDLAGQPVAKSGTVTAGISWLVPTNDYDLQLSSSTASSATEDFQPIDPAEESTSITRTKHCDTVVVTAVDFLAPVVVDTISYTASVR